jgi:CRP-like cAMP-binding protein
VTINFEGKSYAYGLAPLVDGLALQHDLVADGHVTALRIPHAAIRAELTRTPVLWESIAAEATRRSRVFMTQWHQFVFDAPLVRAASLLLGLVAKSGRDDGDGPVAIDLRLPQERLAEMLGTSRQWATAMVRELSDAGLVEWRYGRVTVLNVKALRVLASSSINVAGQQGVRHGGRREVGRGAALATIN